MRNLVILALSATLCFAACRETERQKKDRELTEQLSKMICKQYMDFDLQKYNYLVDRLSKAQSKDKINFGKDEFVVTVFTNPRSYNLQGKEYALNIWPDEKEIRKSCEPE
jgi:hypothetical protein